ncbi:MAG: hypothetical protein JWO83_92 [Caulobacteraceae bacterium]|jgi:hypothetical protein|nr:hypothetical protein [Caulobacteraceae bacterium]
MKHARIRLFTVALGPVTAFAAAAHATENAGVNWTRFYVGVNLGWSGSTNRQKVATSDHRGSLVDPSGPTQAVMFPSSSKGGGSGVAGGVSRRYLAGAESTAHSRGFSS